MMPQWWIWHESKSGKKARILGELRRSGCAMSRSHPSNVGDGNDYLQHEPFIGDAFSLVGRKASCYHIYTSWLQKRHISQTKNQRTIWCCCTDRKKIECWFFLGLEDPVNPVGIIQWHLQLQTGSSKWREEVRQILEYFSYFMCCSRCQRTSQSGSLLSWKLHSKNNYIIKQTKIKWYLIYISSLGIEWRLTNVDLVCKHSPFLHPWQTFAKSVTEHSTQCSQPIKSHWCQPWKPKLELSYIWHTYLFLPILFSFFPFLLL